MNSELLLALVQDHFCMGIFSVNMNFFQFLAVFETVHV